MTRLNGIVGALESSGTAFVAFSSAETERAVSFGGSGYDGVIIETEHTGFDARRIQDFLQYLLDRRYIAQSGNLAPEVTPVVRVPSIGSERNHWFVKQALDAGAYGIVFPHVDSVGDARFAVGACRYPQEGGPGGRGIGAGAAARYFGLSPSEYYRCAGVWPLDPAGEVIVVIMIESRAGVDEVGEMLSKVPGIGCVLIGHGDLSQSLGVHGQYDHPDVLEAHSRVLNACRSAGVACGVVAAPGDVERRVDEGYRLIVVQPEISYAGLQAGRRRAGRAD